MNNKIIKKTLKNGVTLYLYIDKSMKRTLVNYMIEYGSSGEYSHFYLNGKEYHTEPGCAHFLEHLLLEHSKYGNLYQNFSKKKYNRNGGTTLFVTHYYFLGVENIYESIEELITSIQDPVFTEEDVNAASKAIIEETKRTRDNKSRTAFGILTRNLYSNLEITHSCLNQIGNEETTKRINYEMLKTCYDAYYTDDNKSLLIAGNINEKEIVNFLENLYDKLPKHKNETKPFITDYGKIRKKEQIEYMNTNEDYITIGFKNKLNKKFNDKEIYYFSNFLLYDKLNPDKKFIKNLKKEEIITRIENWGTLKISNDIIPYISSETKNYKKFIKLLKEELQKNNFKKKDFELFIKSNIANQAYRIDYKYDFLTSFIFNLEVSEDFDDIDFLKTLTYERFIEFFETLNYNTHTTAIIRNKE